MGRQFKPGFRTPPPAGRVDEGSVLWLTTSAGRITLKVYEKNERQGEVGVNCGLNLRFASGGFRTVDLTALTESEFLALQDFFNRAAAIVLPIIRARDKAADDAYAAGDGSFDRSYRALPTLVDREWSPGEHLEGIFNGPEDASSGDGEAD